MKAWTRSAAVLLSLWAVVGGAGEPEADAIGIEMHQGVEKVLTVPGVQRLAIGDVAVAEVRLGEGDEIVITARGPGKTTLMVWSNGVRRAYLISVR